MINNHIIDLINYAIEKRLIQNEDFEYSYNRVTDILKVKQQHYVSNDNKRVKQLSIILNLILDFAYNNRLFTPNSTKQRDLFESKLMDVFSSLPSDLNKTFSMKTQLKQLTFSIRCHKTIII